MVPVMVRDDFKGTWAATAGCCVGVVVTGLLFEQSFFGFCIAAALCSGLLFYGTSACGSRIKTAKLLLFNSGFLALIVVLLRVILNNVAFHFPPVFWPWFHRIFRVWWLSECSSMLLALIGIGLLAIEVADKVGGNTTRKRFQWTIIAAASAMLAVNLFHLFRPVWCADCFFPYGLPFTLYTQGGFAGSAGFVWTGLVGDAALIPAFAAICTLLWNKVAT